MNVLHTTRRAQVIAALVEGSSINATCRMTGVAKHTVLKLLKGLGCACAHCHQTHVRNLHVRRAQCDEIWAFVYAKQKNVTAEQMGQGAGDVWTWTAIDADTKLIISYMLGDRGVGTAAAFMRDVASRVSNRIQLTTDGHHVYVDAVEAPTDAPETLRTACWDHIFFEDLFSKLDLAPVQKSTAISITASASTPTANGKK